MKCIILGSGTCVPSLKRVSSSILIETEDKSILMDTGMGCTRRLLESGRSIDDIDIILYSHLHPDHTGEFVPIIFSMKYGRQKTDGVISVMGGKGLVEFYENLKPAYSNWIDIGERLILKEFDIITTDIFSMDSTNIETFPVNHRPESVAFKISDKLSGKRVVYSGDMDITDNFSEFCKGADLLILESSTPDKMKLEGHITPSIAGQIASDAGAGRLVLTHFYPECEMVDIQNEARTGFNGELIIACDLMEIEI